VAHPVSLLLIGTATYVAGAPRWAKGCRLRNGYARQRFGAA
jgi:hypothetical protein